MASFGYFILENSDETLTKKFRVIYSGYKRNVQKAGTIENTLDGELDITMGSIKERHSYIVRVRENEPETGFGSKADLETFFRLNNPNATPSYVLKFTDHYGADHNAVMWGDFTEQTLGIMIEGQTAWFYVDCLFIFL